jgi:YVTN family beta-propeller protein
MRNIKFFGATLVIALITSLGITLGTTQAAEATTPDTFFSTTVGTIPWGVVLSPDGTKAYVANNVSRTVSEVSTISGAVLHTYGVSGSPRSLAVTPNGEKLFVASYGYNGTVTEIDLLMEDTSEFPVGKYPTSVAISTDGERAYVTNSNGSTSSDSGTISVIGIGASGVWSTVESTVTVNGGPTAIALSPNGLTGYVTLSQLNQLVSVDLTTPTFPVVKSLSVGSNPTSVVVSSDAQGAFVGNELGNTVSAVWLNESITDPTDPDFDMRIDGTVSVGLAPNSLAFSPNNSHLYVTNFFDGDVSVINTSTLLVEETIGIGTYVGGVAASPDGSKIFVTAMSDYTTPGSLQAINVASPMAMTLHVTDVSGPYILPIQGLWGTVAWGDGTFSSHYGQSNISHTYPSVGTYLVTITGGATGYGDAIFAKKGKVTSVASWGDFASSPYFETLDSAFFLEPELTALPADFPSYVISASYMFTGADLFNQDISSWDVSGLVDMSGMFYATSAFNAPIGTWVISSATNVTSMFKEAYAFNQDLSNWHTNQLFYFDNMFEDAESFNQDLSNWSIQSLTSATNFLDGTAMSSLNYSKLLRAWSQQDVNPGVHLDAHNTMYFETMDYFRDHLIEEEDWIILDDGPTPLLPATLVTAPIASSIQPGQQTAESSLSGGVASQPGSFTFTNPAAVLSSGPHNVSVTFTPDDPLLFGPFSTLVNINVIAPAAPASPAIETTEPLQFLPKVTLAESLLSPAPHALDKALSDAGSQKKEETLSSSPPTSAPAEQTPLVWLFAGTGFTLLVATGIFIRMRTRAKF